jgi:hypothetical protein
MRFLRAHTEIYSQMASGRPLISNPDKVVEGLVPALPTADFVTTAKPKRNIKAKVYKDCETTNIIERRLIKNSKGLKVPDYNTNVQNNLNIHSSWKQLSTGTNC